MKIFYTSSKYQSHFRVATVYKEIIQEKYRLTPSLVEADVVIVHHEPEDFGAVYRKQPILRNKYVVAYCVWEASELPDAYRHSIDHVQEVWTCSEYCRKAFSAHHPNVHYIPHVVERRWGHSAQDLSDLKAAVGYDEGSVYYLTITKLWDRRKNIRDLLNAFREIRQDMPAANLIVKGEPQDQMALRSAEDNIICLNSQLTDRQINALYALSDVYVSVHHAEGWGLTLSDAMLSGKLTIATGYSGNLEFMTPDNSYLIGYREEHIRGEDCFGLFAPHMKWAYPLIDDIAAKLLAAYEDVQERRASQRVRQSARDIARFKRGAIQGHIWGRLEEIASGQ